MRDEVVIAQCPRCLTWARMRVEESQERTVYHCPTCGEVEVLKKWRVPSDA